jgi:hypothetical protein
MGGPLKELPRRWRSLAIVVLPGAILSPLWVVGVSADVAAWRIQEFLSRSLSRILDDRW